MRTKDEGEAGSSLELHASAEGKLSKAQRRFRKLVREISELEDRIAREGERLETLLQQFGAEVLPEEKKLATAMLRLARMVDRVSGRQEVGRRQREVLAEMIESLCLEAFAVEWPDEEADALFERWTGDRYETWLGRRRESRSDAGDESDDSESSPDLDEQPSVGPRGHAGDEESDSHSRERLRRRERAEQRDAATRRSIRSVYLSLAKALHPDVVTDAAERSLREGFMKQATSAYRGGDLATLLELEMRWTNPAAAGDQTLRSWIPALEKQVLDLKTELRGKGSDARFDRILPVASLPDLDAMREVSERARLVRDCCALVDSYADEARDCRSTAQLVSLARRYLRDFD